MDFLMEAFKRNLSEFDFFQFSLEKDLITGNYTLMIWDHPIKLDLILINLVYEEPVCKKEQDSEGECLTFKQNYIKVFDDSPNQKTLVATFCENNYAKKINKIAHTLRDYKTSMK